LIGERKTKPILEITYLKRCLVPPRDAVYSLLPDREDI
jgi:hypothetical protein